MKPKKMWHHYLSEHLIKKKKKYVKSLRQNRPFFPVIVLATRLIKKIFFFNKINVSCLISIWQIL